ncbi:MAG: serine/threonine-protein kinase [Acidobacteriota bacterium]
MDSRLALEKRFHALLDVFLEMPAAERAAALDALDGDDASLRERLTRALDFEDEAVDDLLEHPKPIARIAAVGSLLAEPLVGDGAFPGGTAFLSGPVPRFVGPYVLHEILGQGGMGRVFRAEQVEPEPREVALKLMRSSIKTPETRRRFEAERRTLDRLEHPNIGRIVDSGTTDDDYPYFAMELLESQSITKYCDRRRLGLRDRLRLLADVCLGLAHAHGRRVLHRDVKPSNILVVDTDGRPTPKIIDFGIATVLDATPDDAIAIRGLTGTPSYMSPEALAGKAEELDARSDIYSCGAVLYELLVGRPPVEAAGGDYPGAVCRIIAGDVEAPSAAIRALEPAAGRKAAIRRGLPGAEALAARLGGALDRLALKALATDPGERYADADDFARALRTAASRGD